MKGFKNPRILRAMELTDFLHFCFLICWKFVEFLLRLFSRISIVVLTTFPKRYLLIYGYLLSYLEAFYVLLRTGWPANFCHLITVCLIAVNAFCFVLRNYGTQHSEQIMDVKQRESTIAHLRKSLSNEPPLRLFENNFHRFATELRL